MESEERESGLRGGGNLAFCLRNEGNEKGEREKERGRGREGPMHII